tara:strand:+ start:502 stop:1290 length:789 start_codon:yes stop_codon:yes gene_type:complete
MLGDRGWLCIPLGPDAIGLPKKPIPLAWTSLEPTEETVQSLPWAEAKGLGIVLGPVSNNLGVLDVDDEAMFSVLVAALGFSQAPRLVSTARNRGHWYCYTLADSPSTWREVTWDGRTVKVELKAHGTQVAAPPTPGYTLLNQNPPQPFDDMEAAFEFFCDVLLDYAPKHFSLAKEEQPRGAGFPRPWSPEVPQDVRNKTAYIEAHKLREAGMPLDQAIGVMSARFASAYQKEGIEWSEIAATVKSAYRKGPPQSQHFGGISI